jgi:DNA-binding NarL/FixJ family response regulator
LLKIKESPLIYQDSLTCSERPLRHFKMSQITILLVEDHPLIRKAWEFILNQDTRFRVIGQCDNGEEAIDLFRELSPHIVIMDICLPGMNGIEATQRIRNHAPDARIIGLSFHIHLNYVQQMMQQGAMGYLTKVCSPEEIFKAITEVQGGRPYVCDDIKNAVMRSLENSDDSNISLN